MPAPYEYAIVRVVPRVEREELVNVGVLLFCEARDVVIARAEIDEARMRALWPDVDVELVRAHVAAIERTCLGEGPIGSLPVRERWRWLVAPRSTIVQTSAAHGGLSQDGESTETLLERLLERMVRLPPRPG